MKAGFLVLGLLLAGQCFAAMIFVGTRSNGRDHKVIGKAEISQLPARLSGLFRGYPLRKE